MMPEAEDNIIDNTGEQTEEVTNTAEVDANADADSQKAENDNYYEELLVSDMNELSDEFAENGRIKITDLKNPSDTERSEISDLPPRRLILPRAEERKGLITGRIFPLRFREKPQRNFPKFPERSLTPQESSSPT